MDGAAAEDGLCEEPEAKCRDLRKFLLPAHLYASVKGEVGYYHWTRAMPAWSKSCKGGVGL